MLARYQLVTPFLARRDAPTHLDFVLSRTILKQLDGPGASTEPLSRKRRRDLCLADIICTTCKRSNLPRGELYRRTWQRCVFTLFSIMLYS